MKKIIFSFFIFLFALTILFSQESDDWFIGKPIADIQFIGLIHIPRSEIDPLIRRFKGQIFNDELWKDLYNGLFSLEYFETVEPMASPGDVERKSVIIKIQVTEKPWIENITIEGNKGLRSGEILDVITLKKDDIYREYKARLDVLAVRNLYLEKGYPSVSVEQYTKPGDKPNTLNWVIQIDEGGKVTVDEIRFSGNSVFSESVLKSKISLKEAGFLQPGAFKESALEEDKLMLVEYMQAKGYIDAKIDDVLMEYRYDEKKDQQRLVITFVLSEGDKYLFGGYSFEGNRIFSTEKLFSVVTHEKDATVNYSRVKTDKARIDDLYYENGYIFNSILMKSNRDEEKKIIYFIISIEERDRSHIENIIIKGNDKTKDHVIMREIPFEVGDIFSKTKIMEGLRNLYNLQYFSTIIPEMIPGSAENLMDLVITVEEQATAEIQFGATLSGLGAIDSSFPISGFVKWNDKNFFGNGQEFKIDLSLAPDTQSLIFGFTEPWMFNKRLTLGTELEFSHKSLRSKQDSLAPIFDTREGDQYPPDPYATWQEYVDSGYYVPDEFMMPIEKWDIMLGFNSGYLWKTFVGDLGIGGGISTGFEYLEYDDDKYRPYDYEYRINNREWFYKNKIFSRIYLNNLDVWYDPSNGYFTSFKSTLAGLFDFELKQYIRLDWKAEGYLTFLKIPVSESYTFKLLLGAHTGLSFILPQPGRILSYGNDGLSIDGTFVGRGWMLSNQVGDQLWESWFEIRSPIVPRLLSFDLFTDVAAIKTQNGLLNIAAYQNNADAIDDSQDLTSLKASNLAISSGFGIRFVIPQFPFRIYLAKRMFFDSENKLNFVNGSLNGLDFIIGISLPLL